MNRWLMVGIALIAVVAVFGLIGVSFVGPSQSQLQLNSIQTVQDALDHTRSEAKNDLNGAQLVITNSGNNWSGVLSQLSSAGTTEDVDTQYGGTGNVVIAGGSATNAVKFSVDSAGDFTIAQGSVAGTCPLTMTIAGTSVTYDC